jgi:hypothetical protein
VLQVLREWNNIDISNHLKDYNKCCEIDHNWHGILFLSYCGRQPHSGTLGNIVGGLFFVAVIYWFVYESKILSGSRIQNASDPSDRLPNRSYPIKQVVTLKVIFL